MNCKYPDLRRVFDYAFLCFLLGNDFLPHFPALNIRTRGIYSLLEAYKETLGKEVGAFIIEDGEINWTRFKKVAMWLAKHEDGWIRTEYLKRGEVRFSTSFKNDAEKEAVFNNAPLVYRATEHYINPTDYMWQKRYYNILFSSEAVTEDICTNYYEGLEWVFKYYTDKCFDWRWKYRFHYPPLLCDLASHSVRTSFFKKPFYNPFSAKTQLAVVLPSADFDFSFLEFEWAFCRYFWEGHLKIDETCISDVENINL
jgi:5'-3' exoribonuclease 2